MDGDFCPPAKYDSPENQGRAKLTVEDGWTTLSFWDRTVDKRACSHSTYVMKGQHTFDEMLQAIKVNFPGIFERYEFKIVLMKGD